LAARRQGGLQDGGGQRGQADLAHLRADAQQLLAQRLALGVGGGLQRRGQAGIQEIGQHHRAILLHAQLPQPVQRDAGGVQQQGEAERHWFIHVLGGAGGPAWPAAAPSFRDAAMRGV
ncbi:hypothetical protein HMPREF0731_2626, partial [Pseudoroseomonas cervicalis ATCC 49957]